MLLYAGLKLVKLANRLMVPGPGLALLACRSGVGKQITKTKGVYKMKHLMRQAIRVLSDTKIYWRFPPAVRLNMVHYFIFNSGK